MSEAATIAGAGWLAEHQRATCVGGAALTTFQGMLADELLIPESVAASGDAEILVLAINGYAEAMQRPGFYLPGEFAPEALYCYYAHDYVTEAREGGHAQYYLSRGGDEIALKCAAAGLKSMLADPYHDLFALMVNLKAAPPRDLRKLLRRERLTSVPTAFRELDRRLRELEISEPLLPRQKAWLRSLRKTKVVPDAAMGEELRRLAAANPLRERRRAEREQLFEQRQQTVPVYRAIKSLCEMAGLRFEGLNMGVATPMRAIWPEGPDRDAYAWRLDTDRGRRVALFYREGRFFKRYLSVLMQYGGALPEGSLTLSREAFETLAPGVK